MNFTMMHGSTNIKFINRPYKCTHTRTSNGNCTKKNAAIWFNKICRDKELNPKFINIRINGNNRQYNNTEQHFATDLTL